MERPFADLRRQAGLDLDTAAFRLRRSPRYLRAVELSRVPLSMSLARNMAAEYGCTLQELIRPAEAGRAGGAGQGRQGSRNLCRPSEAAEALRGTWVIDQHGLLREERDAKK
jgi:transcriptional regulator with XRE-family HTH domain